MNIIHHRAVAMVLSTLGLGALPAHAITFTLDTPSVSVPAVGLPDDLFNPGPVIAVPGAGPVGINVDAISYGRTTPVEDTEFYFSVDAASAGAPGTAVAGESAFSDHPADIFVSTGGGMNFQFRDGNGIVANPLTPGAPSPPLGLAEPLPGSDNVDGLDLRVIGPVVYWSVDAATVAGVATYAGSSTADVFLAPAAAGYSGLGVGALYAPAALLGLLVGDDIDAMVYYEDALPGATLGDVMLFSLAPGSPTLGLLGASAADILATSPGAGPGVFLTAGALGLLPGDNLDALDVIPEPSAPLLLGVAFAGLALRRRRA